MAPDFAPWYSGLRPEPGVDAELYYDTIGWMSSVYRKASDEHGAGEGGNSSQEQANRKVLARFTDVCEKQFS